MKAPTVDKETLNAAIRKAIETNGGKRVCYRDFIAASGLSFRDVFHNYPKWEEAMCGAGFAFQPYNSPLLPDVLLAEWGTVVRKIRQLPTQHEYRLHCPRDAGTVALRFGSWHRVPDAFRRFAEERTDWADVVALIDSLPPRARSRPAARPRFVRKSRPGKVPARPVRRLRDRHEYGDQLDFPSLRHAPSNELGVVYLFGIMAEQLGFAVERIQTAFPDCLAKHRIGGGNWQNVAIKFEYESRNFRTHGHDPDGCDIIVCWVHNWADCPKNLEVIALSEEIKRLDLLKLKFSVSCS